MIRQHNNRQSGLEEHALLICIQIGSEQSTDCRVKLAFGWPPIHSDDHDVCPCQLILYCILVAVPSNQHAHRGYLSEEAWL